MTNERILRDLGAYDLIEEVSRRQLLNTRQKENTDSEDASVDVSSKDPNQVG